MPGSPSPRLALVLIDRITSLDFEGGRSLLRKALPVATRIARLKARCRRAGIPVIYANDNYGQWRSDLREVIGALRHFEVRVPADCTASISKTRNDRALGLLKASLRIDTRDSARIRLA